MEVATNPSGVQQPQGPHPAIAILDELESGLEHVDADHRMFFRSKYNMLRIYFWRDQAGHGSASEQLQAEVTRAMQTLKDRNGEILDVYATARSEIRGMENEIKTLAGILRDVRAEIESTQALAKSAAKARGARQSSGDNQSGNNQPSGNKESSGTA